MQFKDKRIKDIVKHLQNKFGLDSIVVKDYWDADNCAIGLTNREGQYIVYISTWKKKDDEYFVSLDSPSEDEAEEYIESGDFDNVRIEKVEEIVRTHLSLK